MNTLPSYSIKTYFAALVSRNLLKPVDKKKVTEMKPADPVNVVNNTKKLIKAIKSKMPKSKYNEDDKNPKDSIESIENNNNSMLPTKNAMEMG